MAGSGGNGQSSPVEVINLNRSCGLNVPFIKKIVGHILKILKKTKAPELEIVFLDDSGIRVFNKRYKNKDAPTDVLSFKIGRKEFGKSGFLGEILISSERALKHSKIFGAEFHDELVRYVIHGILHLLGYNDESPALRLKMFLMEEKVLGRLCAKQRLSKVLMPR